MILDSVDNNFSLKQIIEETVAHGSQLHLVYIDLRKAYDSVPVEMLWQAMREYNVNIQYVNNQICSHIRDQGVFSEQFSTRATVCHRYYSKYIYKLPCINGQERARVCVSN